MYPFFLPKTKRPSLFAKLFYILDQVFKIETDIDDIQRTLAVKRVQEEILATEEGEVLNNITSCTCSTKGKS